MLFQTPIQQLIQTRLELAQQSAFQLLPIQATTLAHPQQTLAPTIL